MYVHTTTSLSFVRYHDCFTHFMSMSIINDDNNNNNYEPQSRFARLWLDMIIAQSDAHNFDAARSMLTSNADTETATQLTTPDA